MKERAQVDALDIGPPTRPLGDTDSMQFIVYVPQKSVLSLLKASSLDGVFIREFYESDADRNRYKIVHLKDGSTIEAAQRQATWMAEMSVGIVSTKRGFAIRVLAAHYDSAIKMLHPDDSERLLGKRWEISGLPLSMGRAALIEFLDTWRVSPEHTFRQGNRRTWIVRAATDPCYTKVQHEHGLAVVKEAQPRPPPNHPKIEKFVANTDYRSTLPASKRPLQPQSWASIVRGSPAAAQAPLSVAPKHQALPTAQPTIGLENMLTVAIAAALKPFQEEFHKMQCAIAQLQEETQCGLSEREDSDMEDTEDIEEKSNSAVAAADGSLPKKPRVTSRTGKVRSKVSKQ